MKKIDKMNNKTIKNIGKAIILQRIDPLKINESENKRINEPENKRIKLQPIIQKCTVKDCNNKELPKTLHLIPTDELIEQLWRQRLQLDKDKASKHNTAVCDEHFEKEDYTHWTENGKFSRLRLCAIPSKNLPSSDKNWLTCLIPNCETNVCSGSENSETMLLHMPKEPEQITKWTASIEKHYGISLDFDEVKEKWICSRHFLCSELKKHEHTGRIYVHSDVLPRKIMENEHLTEPLLPQTTSDPPQYPILYFKNKSTHDRLIIPIKPRKQPLIKRKLKAKTKKSVLEQEPADEEDTSNGICCRLCLTKDKTVRSYQIDGNLNDAKLSDIILELFSIKTAKSDQVTKICEQCLVKIDIAKSIYDAFQKSDQVFRELFHKIEKNVENETQDNLNGFERKNLNNFEISEDDKGETLNNFEISEDDKGESDCNEGVEEDEFFTKHKSAVYCCHLCSIELKTDFDLRKHQQFDHKIPDMGVCSFCGYVARNVSKIRQHEKNVHMKADFECSVCHKIYLDLRSLNMHKFEHDPDYRPICLKCGQDFDSEELKQEHTVKVHHYSKLSDNGARIKCDCGETFKQPKQYIHHFCEHKTKVGGKIFSPNNCPLCDASDFPNHERLLIHINTKHPKESKSLHKYKCDQCTLSFIDPIRLFYHERRCTK